MEEFPRAAFRFRPVGLIRGSGRVREFRVVGQYFEAEGLIGTSSDMYIDRGQSAVFEG